MELYFDFINLVKTFEFEVFQLFLCISRNFKHIGLSIAFILLDWIAKDYGLSGTSLFLVISTKLICMSQGTMVSIYLTQY